MLLFQLRYRLTSANPMAHAHISFVLSKIETATILGEEEEVKGEKREAAYIKDGPWHANVE